MNPETQTILDRLADHAQQSPGRLALRFLKDRGESDCLTYGQLASRVAALADQLQDQAGPGDRALLLYQPGLEFIEAFLGCLAARIIAVPAYPPRKNRSADRLHAIIRDCSPRLLLTTGQVARSLGPELLGGEGGPHCFCTDAVPPPSASGRRLSGPGPADVAFLQYTSGSTGSPRGVIISHGNIVHNEQAIQASFGHTAESVLVSWLPMFHDMGLIGAVLQPLYVGFPVVLMAPAAFLQEPNRWLRAIMDYRGTTAGGPNFGWEHCLDRVTEAQKDGLDLSSLRVAFNGAEPVRPETLDRFTAAFSRCGFRPQAFFPCYGLAESTLLVSGGPPQRDPVRARVSARGLEAHAWVPSGPDETAEARWLVSSGRVVAGMRVEVVNPETCCRCGPRQIGEVWIASPSVAQGYWNRPEETQQLLQAVLADSGDGPFLRTGDLGYLDGDELFITGRLKDLVIIRGRNIYPQDVEAAVERTLPFVEANTCAAFATVQEGTERLAVVVEASREMVRLARSAQKNGSASGPGEADPAAALHELVECLRGAVTEEFEIPLHAVVFIRPGTFPRTSSGKVQRRACREGFLAGTLEVVHQWLDSDEAVPAGVRHNYSASLESWLQQQVQEVVGLAVPPRPDKSLFDLGIDSLKAVELTNRLQRHLRPGLSLPSTLAFDYPTISRLAQHLAEQVPSPADATNQRAGGRGGPTEEPVALVGLACRLPGAPDQDAFWQLLLEGGNAITEVPADRWDPDAYYDPNPDTPEKMTTRWGGFIEGIDRFDSAFFGISPREAQEMDPQHRLLLELSWHALEDAGLDPSRLAGSRTGVYVGISTSDYAFLLLRARGRGIGSYLGTGNAHAAAAGRISYFLGLEGPCLAIDTACSSSLVALHQACRALQRGDCDLALAAGVNALLAPETTISFSKGRFMASDGQCKTFDASADGYVRGEGGGVVVLKRLSEARRDGDRILAVVRGSAVNQDGASGGLTVPSGLAQQRVIREALRQAGVAPGEVNYLETHGTGTSLGDPIEVQAAAAVLCEGRPADRPLLLGSVKTNIGHLEAAAGIAGLIKVVLAMRHGIIPPQLHFCRPNDHIRWEELPVAVTAAAIPWGGDGKRPLAGVSSFGFAGTNAHVVLEGAAGIEAAGRQPSGSSDLPEGLCPVASIPATSGERNCHLLLLSGKSAEALRELAGRYGEWLAAHPDADLADVCFTAGVGRSHFEHRAALVVGSHAEAIDLCTKIRRGERAAGLVSGQAQSRSNLTGAFGTSGVPPGPATPELMLALARQYVLGSMLDLRAFDSPGPRRKLSLPAYPFQRQRHWFSGRHPSLPTPLRREKRGEVRIDLASGETVLRQELSSHSLPFLVDHQVYDTVVVPGAHFLVLVLQECGLGSELADTTLLEPMLLHPEDRRELEVLFSPPGARGDRTFRISSRPAAGGPWVVHCQGKVRQLPTGETKEETIPLPTWKTNQASQDGSRLYTDLGSLGLQYGPAFRLIRTIWRADQEALVELLLPENPARPADPALVATPLLDACCQAIAALGLANPDRSLFLPASYDRLRLYDRLPEHFYCLAHYRPDGLVSSEALDFDLTFLDLDGKALGYLSGFHLRRAPRAALLRGLDAEADRTAAASLCWRLEWTVADPLPPAATAGSIGTWLVGGSRAGAEVLGRKLRQHGHTVTLLAEVLAGAEDDSAALRRVLGENGVPKFTGLAIVVEGAAPPATNPLSPAEAPVRGLLELVQCCTETAQPLPHGFWLVTEAAQALEAGEPVSPLAAALWGLGRVVLSEHPQLNFRLLDIPSFQEMGDELVRLLQANLTDRQLLLRQGRIYTPRLVPVAPAADRPTIFSGGTYLITGGTGALGLHTAGWLVERGARSLVLLARRPPGAASLRQLAALEAAGCRVLVRQADVSVREHLAQVLDEIAASLPPLAGVIHAAGILDEGLLVRQDWSRFLQVLEPKVVGAWNLHELTAAMPLQCFICYSSVASVLGTPGQASYAMGNAFLDGLAHLRRSQGLPALSVNWGAWSGGGMADRDDVRQMLPRIGMKYLTPATAFAALDDLLSVAPGQAVVADADWRLLMQALPSAGQFLPRAEHRTASGSPNAEGLLAVLAAAEPPDREAILCRELQGEVARILQLSGPDQAPQDRLLADLGVDSLLALEFREAVEKRLGQAIHATMLFTNSTLNHLARHLLDQVIRWPTTIPGNFPSVVSDP